MTEAMAVIVGHFHSYLLPWGRYEKLIKTAIASLFCYKSRYLINIEVESVLI
jgi:hypothetical protein